jgi:hypothetical protein
MSNIKILDLILGRDSIKWPYEFNMGEIKQASDGRVLCYKPASLKHMQWSKATEGIRKCLLFPYEHVEFLFHVKSHYPDTEDILATYVRVFLIKPLIKHKLWPIITAK